MSGAYDVRLSLLVFTYEEDTHVMENTCAPIASRALIRPFCITILYHNLLLFIDIFHI
jgi:hypothetical protein